MNLVAKLKIAEARHRLALEDYFITVFGNTSLSSHDLNHHRRVWCNAKEIMEIRQVEHGVYSQDFIDSLLIACYLHDLGMVTDPGERHGQISRHLTSAWIGQMGFDSSGFTEALDAIEYHDRKDYTETGRNGEMLIILSAADDLDAFGIAGIYRYIEIYLLRGIKFTELGQAVMKNAAARFAHLQETFIHYPTFIERQRKRYLELDDFFNNFVNAAPAYNFENEAQEGACGIAGLISETITGKRPLATVMNQEFLKKYDNEIRTFFTKLENEICPSSI